VLDRRVSRQGDFHFELLQRPAGDIHARRFGLRAE